MGTYLSSSGRFLSRRTASFIVLETSRASLEKPRHSKEHHLKILV